MTIQTNNRLLSLDFFRGLTMFLLIAEFTGLYHYLRDSTLEGTFIYAVALQLKHPVWDDGMTFWDTIHPFFIFTVGVSMPFSFSKRQQEGGAKNGITTHVFKRSFLLILIGWLIVCISNGKVVLSFLDVLCSIGFSYPIAYFIMRYNVRVQLVFSFSLILMTELLYRYFPLEGYNQPFVAGHNFGQWVDVVTAQTNPGHWSFFNKIPTTAHIVWGVLVGKLLLIDTPKMKKVEIMLICGVAGLVLGYALSPFTPMIKRIATSTWILASAGLAVLVFAVCYWAIDIKKYITGVRFFSVVGMNPLFIYVFVSIGGARFLKRIVDPFATSLFSWTGELTTNIISAVTVLFLLWYMCFWLFRNKLFFRL